MSLNFRHVVGAALLWLAFAQSAPMGQSAWAQNVADEAHLQRQKIAAQRSELQASYQGQKKACYQTFAVNDCLEKARQAQDRQGGELRRQELSLDDVKRRAAAAKRLRTIDEKSSASKQEKANLKRARELNKTPKSQAAPQPNKRTGGGEGAEAFAQRQRDAAERASAQAQKVADAQTRQRQLAQREQERLAKKKQPSQALPTP